MRPTYLKYGDVLRLTRPFTDSVVRLSAGRKVHVLAVSERRVMLTFKVMPRLVNNCDRDRALFSFDGFRWCRWFNTADIISHVHLFERDGKEPVPDRDCQFTGRKATMKPECIFYNRFKPDSVFTIVDVQDVKMKRRDQATKYFVVSDGSGESLPCTFDELNLLPEE